MSDTFYVGEYGKTLKLETGQDLSGYAIGDLSIEVVKPDKTAVSWPAASLSDGEKTGSIIEYVLADGDLDIRGNYVIQSQVDNGTTVREVGDPTSIKVLNKGETTR